MILQQAYQHLELLKLSKEHYRKKWYQKTTKKDRRDIDEFGNEIIVDEED
jgi:ribosome-associated heat shock protein Hsp15